MNFAQCDDPYRPKGGYCLSAKILILKMKSLRNLCFILFAIINMILIQSCEKEIIDVDESNSLNINKSQNSNLRFHTVSLLNLETKNPESKLIDVKIVKTSIGPKIIGDKINSKLIKVGNVKKYIYFYEDGNNNAIRQTDSRNPFFQTGYLWYSDGGGYGCFVYSLYIEDSHGNILILDTCSYFNCIGFDSECGYFA